ncbi:MAG: hypothetical protein ACYCPT_12885 [Acidimicrobiales bacterium]
MSAGSRAGNAAAFCAFIDQSVLAAVRSGITTFTSLLRYLPSVYPTEVLASLARLGQTNAIDPVIVKSAYRQSSTRPVEPPTGWSPLPLPHPLDFEWRFTPDTSRDLLDAACALTRPNGQMLLFGTPGLAVEALSLPMSRRLSFLGEDNVVTRRIIALNRVIGSPLSVAFCGTGFPRESADAILLDPPWYIDFIRPMLAAAAGACRHDGVVLVSLPPVGTRPSALADQDKVLRFAAKLGLDVVEERRLAIAYETPFFETNALAAAGVFSPSPWRRGDLITFRRSRKLVCAANPTSEQRREWIETAVGRMRLFIKPDYRPASGLSGLIPMVSGDILPSVSRRDPRRRNAQVWTSGNRVFRTDNAELVLAAAIACRKEEIGPDIKRRLWDNPSERGALERVRYELEAIATQEAEEERGLCSEARGWSVPWMSSSTNFCSMLTAIVSG